MQSQKLKNHRHPAKDCQILLKYHETFHRMAAFKWKGTPRSPKTLPAASCTGIVEIT